MMLVSHGAVFRPASSRYFACGVARTRVSLPVRAGGRGPGSRCPKVSSADGEDGLLLPARPMGDDEGLDAKGSVGRSGRADDSTNNRCSDEQGSADALPMEDSIERDRMQKLLQIQADMEWVAMMLDPSILEERRRRARHQLYSDARRTLHMEVTGVPFRPSIRGRQYWNRFIKTLQQQEGRLTELGLPWESLKLTGFGRGGRKGREDATQRCTAEDVRWLVERADNPHLQRLYDWLLARQQPESAASKEYDECDEP